MGSAQFHVEDSGLVSNPSIHDGLLLSVSAEADTCRLQFRRSSGERLEFILGQVKFLKADDFMLGNIVGEIFVYQGEKIPEARLRELLYRGQEIELAHLESVKKQCLRHKLFFFRG